MSVYAIADTHLSLSDDKPMDIFGGWQDYVFRLETNWRRLITDDDTVVIAGDISWAMSLEGAKEDFRFLNSLPGKKLIFKGNHDYWWCTMKKMEEFLSENGFDTIKILHNSAVKIGDYAVCGSRGWFFDDESGQDNKIILREAGRLRRSIEEAKALGGEPIVFLHYPPLSSSAVCSEIFGVLKEEGIRRCYYGHLHGPALKSAFIGEKDGIRFNIISCDYLGFCPLLVEKI
ncbi:MAG: metallophosphoesterase [Acutalibacteraceae bacterium]